MEDPKFWIQLISLIGFPAAACHWLAKHILIPLKDAHLKRLESDSAALQHLAEAVEAFPTGMKEAMKEATRDSCKFQGPCPLSQTLSPAQPAAPWEHPR